MRRALLATIIITTAVSAFAQKECHQSEYRNLLLSNDPAMSSREAQIENFISNRSLIRNNANREQGIIVPEIIKIPVVVHILYNSSQQNISDAQIMSQMDVLNMDFGGLNEDRLKVPSYFSSSIADCKISFVLAKIDPGGKATNGIVRKQTGVKFFNLDDRAKSTANGGDNAWDADQYLNIWVCNLVSGVLGYSSLPGGPADKDGVVISTTVFGTFNSISPFNKGRTATHEIGHWLNLKHIWGDGVCGDDKVNDTPSQERANRGCPGGEKITCGTSAHGDMYMNFMDLTDDACMYMFTHGQKERMRALFAQDGPRNLLLSSNGLNGSGLPAAAALPVADGRGIILFPVPASDQLQVRITAENCIGKMIVVYNQLGQIVVTQRISRSTEAVDISGLHAGNYYLKVEGSKTLMAKFVKL